MGPLKKKVKGRARPDKSDSGLAERLKKKDPEFFEFLKNEDKDLLDDIGNVSDEDSDDEQLHIPTGELEVAGNEAEEADDFTDDESEDEVKPAKKKKSEKITKVSRSIVDKWRKELTEKPTEQILEKAVQAFKAAVNSVAGIQDDDFNYVVEGGDNFNAISQLCLAQFVPAVSSILGMPELNEDTSRKEQLKSPAHSKHWSRVKDSVKTYLQSILNLIACSAEAQAVNTLLRHSLRLLPFYQGSPKRMKALIDTCTKLWARADDETTRVLSFLVMYRLLRSTKSRYLSHVLKNMYLAYVKNNKFAKYEKLPLVLFMQRSYVEMLALDINVSYQLAFVYIRQQAIHLRNAFKTKKSDEVQLVYNWQYIRCLELWTAAVSSLQNSGLFGQLIYPVVQIITGTAKLLPNPRFFPLRYHCVMMLNTIARKTNKFIPITQLILEIFSIVDFNKRDPTFKLKAFNFTCLIRLSNEQLNDRAYKDALVDHCFDMLMETFHTYENNVAFPEIAIPVIVRLKKFLKTSKVTAHSQIMKNLVTKMKDHMTFIEGKRQNLRVTDTTGIAAWSREIASGKTPLGTFYTTWRKTRDQEILMQMSNKDGISGPDGMTSGKVAKDNAPVATNEEREEFSQLFDSGSDEFDFELDGEKLESKKKTKSSKRPKLDDSDSDEEPAPSPKKKKKVKKEKKGKSLATFDSMSASKDKVGNLVMSDSE